MMAAQLDLFADEDRRGMLEDLYRSCPPLALMGWARTPGAGGSLPELWERCPKGEWLAWLWCHVYPRRGEMAHKRAIGGALVVVLDRASAVVPDEHRRVCDRAIGALGLWASGEPSEASHVQLTACASAARSLYDGPTGPAWTWLALAMWNAADTTGDGHALSCWQAALAEACVVSGQEMEPAPEDRRDRIGWSHTLGTRASELQAEIERWQAETIRGRLGRW